MPSRNKDVKNATNTRYYQKHKERICAELRVGSKEHYAANRERLLSNSRKFRQENPERYLLSNIKSRCKRENIPFNLELSDLEIPTHCPLLGIPLVHCGENWENSPSIDRLIPELGYVKQNIWIISMRANRIKCDATLSELKQITQQLEIKFKEINELL